jgi:hypothetical protein
MEPRPLFNPFPGLRPFEPDEDHLFFGREKEIDDLLRRLRVTRFLSVVGSSGSGKSSLVRSGLIPSLYSGFMVQAGSGWRVAIFRPGEDPVGHMATALDHPDVLGADDELADTRRVLLDATLRRSTLGLVEAVRQARLPAGDNVLLVVDQFEELFRFDRSRRIQGARADAMSFVRLLLEASRQTSVPLYVVLTMRSDFIGDCMEFPGLPEAVNEGQYLVPRMTRDELRSAVTGPVAVGGGEIAPRLVTRLLNDVGEDQDQLPILQHALMRTWDYWEQHRRGREPIDLEHYGAIGTMTRALAMHAEEAYAEIASPRGHRTAEALFKALTDTFSDSRGVRRPTAVAEIAAIAETDEAEVIAVADTFRQRGRTFLMPPPGVPLGPHSILDLSHESLMRRWHRLIEWAEEERVAAEFYVRLSRSAAWHAEGTAGLWRDPELTLGVRWRDENQPNRAWAERYDANFDRAAAFLRVSEQARDRDTAREEAERRAKLRRAWQVAGTLSVLLILTAGLALYAWIQRARATEQRIRADRNLGLAKSAVDEMLSAAGRQSARVAAAVPELEEFRRELLEKALIFYRDFGNQRPDSTELRAEIARAHARVGDIYRLLARTEDARREYEDAIERFSALASEHPANPEYRQALANVHNWLGELLRPMDTAAAAADAAYDAALRVQQALHEQFPQDSVYQRELARTYYNRGILRATRGHDAAADYRAAIDLLKPLATAERPDARQELARALNNYGLLLANQHKLAEARALIDDAIGIHRVLVAQDPGNREYDSELAKFSNNAAIVLLAQGALRDAHARNQEAFALFDRLARPGPSLSSELAHTRNLRGRILEEQSQFAEAGMEYRAAVNVFKALDQSGSAAAQAEFRLRFGEALYDLAGWQIRHGDLDAAASALTDAIAQHKAPPAHTVHLAYDYLMLAKVELGRRASAAASAAVQNLQAVLTALPDEDRRTLAPHLEQLQAQLGVRPEEQ